MKSHFPLLLASVISFASLLPPPAPFVSAWGKQTQQGTHRLTPGEPVAAQDPTKVAPQAYSLAFENDWVRVTRVHYGAHEKVPAHAHSQYPVAYVYLNDSGPIIFRHRGWDHPDLTRPATKAGSFRLSPTTAVGEVHEVENPNDTPSDFLRVEFKTAPDNEKPPRGRFHRGNHPPGENFREVQFENRQVRITRVVCGKGACEDGANASAPALLVAFSSMRLNWPRAGLKEVAAGQTAWLGAGEWAEARKDGVTPAEYLRIEFVSRPLRAK